MVVVLSSQHHTVVNDVTAILLLWKRNERNALLAEEISENVVNNPESMLKLVLWYFSRDLMA